MMIGERMIGIWFGRSVRLAGRAQDTLRNSSPHTSLLWYTSLASHSPQSAGKYLEFPIQLFCVLRILLFSVW